MARFIVIDHYDNQLPVDVEADTHEEAARTVATPEALADCLSPVLQVAKPPQPNCKGAVCFCDEASNEGWGPGCKFEGRGMPKSQVFVTAIKIG